MRKSVSIVLVLLFMAMAAIVPLASAQAILAETTIVGGGALTLSALLDLLMVSFGASGMDGAVRNQASSTGTLPVPYVGQLLNRYLELVLDGIGVPTWADPIQRGLSILANGTIYLDSGATAAIADFQRWAWDEDGGDLIDYAPVNAPDYMTDGSFDVAFVTCNNLVDISGTSYYYPNAGYRPSSTSSWNLMTVGSTLQGAQFYVYGYIQRNNSGNIQGYKLYAAPANVYSCTALLLYYGGTSTSSAQITYTLTESTFTQITTASAALPGDYDGIPVNDTVRTSFDVSDFSGDPVPIGDVDSFVGPMQQGEGTMLPLGDYVTVSPDAAATLHFTNYLRAAASAYAGAGTAQVPVTDVGSGEDELLPLSVPLDTPIGVTGVTDAEIAGTGSVAATDSVASNFEGVDDYTMDLTQFFPFCVPFDLGYLFDKLRADPEALVIHWRFVIPYLDVDIPIDIDLSPFDSIATLLRSLEVIAFIVVLIVGTKGLIQGGD